MTTDKIKFDFDSVEQDLLEAFAEAKQYKVGYGDRTSQAANRQAMAEITIAICTLRAQRMAEEEAENTKKLRAKKDSTTSRSPA